MLGAMNLKSIYNVFKKLYKEKKQEKELKKQKLENLNEIIKEKSKSPYQTASQDSSVDLENQNFHEQFAPVKLQSIEADVVKATDINRIVRFSEGETPSSLYEFVPATKIKGIFLILREIFSNLSKYLMIYFYMSI